LVLKVESPFFFGCFAVVFCFIFCKKVFFVFPIFPQEALPFVPWRFKPPLSSDFGTPTLFQIFDGSFLSSIFFCRLGGPTLGSVPLLTPFSKQF